MDTFVFVTEEIVVRHVTVVANNRTEAEAKLWNGKYADSKDIDRRDEKIVGLERLPGKGRLLHGQLG